MRLPSAALSGCLRRFLPQPFWPFLPFPPLRLRQGLPAFPRRWLLSHLWFLSPLSAQVLLRVKENELQYVKKEVQCLREELQMMQKVGVFWEQLGKSRRGKAEKQQGCISAGSGWA